jgi:hypothetical protein
VCVEERWTQDDNEMINDGLAKFQVMAIRLIRYLGHSIGDISKIYIFSALRKI